MAKLSISKLISHFSNSQELSQPISYDKDRQTAVIRCSICTGEQVAGFKNLEDGSFTEVMLIKNEDDLELFKKTYGLSEVKKIY